MDVAKILTTSVTGIALAFSMLASTLPANAASGYHAAYFSESDFLARNAGETGQFAVGYTNTGDQSWVKGAANQQANLATAAPLDNFNDFTAGWSNGWLASNRYTAQDAALVAPGQIGFFIYNFTVPTTASAGEHRFYGREVVDGVTFMEDFGYYQSVTVGALGTSGPTFTSVTAAGTTLGLTFSEPVCRVAGDPFDPAAAVADYLITVNGVSKSATADAAPVADPATSPTNCVRSYNVSVADLFVDGDFVAVTLTATGAAKIQNAAGNPSTMQTRTATAMRDTTKPFITAAAAQANGTTLKLTYSEAVLCNNAGFLQFAATPTGGSATPASSTTCINVEPGTTTITAVFPAGTFATGVGGSLTYTQDAATPANRIKDRVTNDATSPQTIAYSAFTADTARPLSQDIRVTTNANFNLDLGDVFTVAFNEVVVAPANATIRLTDGDGTVADVICGSPAAGTNATCTLKATATTIGGVSYPAGQVITVTMTANLTPVTAGTTIGLQIPSTVIGSLLIADTAGNTWDIATSPDKTLNQ